MTSAIDKAISDLKASKVIGFATETVFGIGVDATSQAAITRLYECKGRVETQPMQILFPDTEAAFREGEASEPAKKLAAAFWPGGLTMILPRRTDSRVSSTACGNGPSIGLRCPAFPLLTELLTAYRKPIAASSANRSGEPTLTDADSIRDQLGIRTVLEAHDAVPAGQPSTVIALKPEGVQFIRIGAISPEEIERVLA